MKLRLQKETADWLGSPPVGGAQSKDVLSSDGDAFNRDRPSDYTGTQALYCSSRRRPFGALSQTDQFEVGAIIAQITQPIGVGGEQQAEAKSSCETAGLVSFVSFVRGTQKADQDKRPDLGRIIDASITTVLCKITRHRHSTERTAEISPERMAGALAYPLKPTGNDGLMTESSEDQRATELVILDILKKYQAAHTDAEDLQDRSKCAELLCICSCLSQASEFAACLLESNCFVMVISTFSNGTSTKSCLLVTLDWTLLALGCSIGARILSSICSASL